MKKLVLGVLIATMALSGCDSDDDKKSSSNNNKINNVNPSGFYDGSFSKNQSLMVIIDKENQLWAFRQGGDDNDAGLIVGNLNVEGSQVKTLGRDFDFINNTKDYSVISAEVREGLAFNGTAESSNQQVNFNSTFANNTSSKKAELKNVVGTYTGQTMIVTSVDSMSYNINDAGKITSNDNECNFTGDIKPFNNERMSYFEVAISFPQANGCSLSGETVTGVALNTSTNLILFTKTKDMSEAMVTLGYKK